CSSDLAKNRQLSYLRHSLEFKIRGERSMPAHIREHGQSSRGDDSTADGEAIQAIGEIHRIACPHDHQDDEPYKGKKCQRPKFRIARQPLTHKVRRKLLRSEERRVGKERRSEK